MKLYFVYMLLLAVLLLECIPGLQSNVVHQTVDGRVAGGTDASPTRRPKFVVHIRAYDRMKNATVTCGGSLISQNYVLTSKRCIINKVNATLTFGVYDMSKTNPRYKKTSVLVPYTPNVRHFIGHPIMDLGLIYMTNPLVLNQGITIATLPSKADVNKNYNGESVRVYGWGETNNAGVPSQAALQVLVSTVSGGCPTCNLNGTCIPGSNGKGTCIGDSGSPLVQINPYVLVGVATRVHEKCGENTPNRFILVNKFLDWIEETTGIPIP